MLNSDFGLTPVRLIRLLVFLCFSCVVLIECTVASGQTNGIPFLNQALNPASIAPGSATFTVTLTGIGFAPTAVVNWNGSPRLTEVISSTEIKATIDTSDIAVPMTGWITVTNPAPGGGTSNVIFFPVRNPLAAVAMAGSQVFGSQLLPAKAVAVGDFNNDGKLDVVWADANNDLNTSLGNGDGTFQPAIQNGAPLVEITQLIAGDFNGDGCLDVAASEAPAYTAIYLGDCHGHFAGVSSRAGATPESVNGPVYIAAAPFGQGNSLELYYTLTNLGSQWFTIGTFSYVVPWAGGFQEAAIGDFNRDGILDLANPTVFLGSADGSFSPLGSESVGGNGAVVADMNNDGRLDTVNSGCIWLGNGDGTFSLGGCATTPPTVGIGDFNGDGILDAASEGAIALGKGDGTFLRSFSFPGVQSPGFYGAIGDFNNDGLLDVLAGNGFLWLQTTAQLSPTSLAFGNQTVGTKSQPQTATLANIGTSQLPITKISITGSGASNFLQTNNCGTGLAAGASCTITVTFRPKAAGTFTPYVSVGYKGVGSPQQISLSGTGLNPPTVTLAPSTLQYPSQLIRTKSSPQVATLTNTGDQPVSISSITVSGVFSQTNDCPSSLPVGTHCSIQVVFQPTTGGPKSGELVVKDNALHSPQRVSLSGIATALSFSPLGVNFGDQKVGTKSATVPVTLTNTGSVSVSIISIAITGTDPNDFTQTNNCGSSLGARSSCTINVVFQPTATGARSAAISVSVSGGGNPSGLPLAGTGT